MTIHKAIICAVAFSFFLGCASHRVVALKVTDEQGIPVSDALVMQVECATFCRYTPFFRGWFMAWRDHTPYYAWIEKNRFEYHYHPYVLVGVTDANGLVHLPLHRLDTIRFELFSVEWGLYAWSYAIRISPFQKLPDFLLRTDPIEPGTLETILEHLDWADSSALKIPFANPKTSTITESFRREICEMVGTLSSATNGTSISDSILESTNRTSSLRVAVEYIE
ncbi:MAG: hypothetical protein IKJ45_14295 [Kiritimatiellae bacterium]|nr:hypothetical protein [Kiritimatiellia bacterium]